MKRHGDVSLALIFSLVCFISIAAFLQSSQRAALTSSRAKREYAEYYNTETLCKLAVQYTLSAISAQSLTVPITPLNSTIYAYESSLASIVLPTSISADELLQIIGNPLVSDWLASYMSGAYISLEIAPFTADYSHQDNLLYFGDGDRLYLEPVTISLTFHSGSAAKDFDYEASGLVCEVQHGLSSFKIKIDDREAVIH